MRIKRSHNWKNVQGQKFNRLLVIENLDSKKGVSYIKCKCDCGNEVIARKWNVTSGDTKSCGCYHSEMQSNRCIEMNYKHGKTYSVEFETWQRLRQRCNNPNNRSYKNYGGRGIKICDTWLNSFENFYKDMGSRPSKKHSIDRINNDKGYSPANCRWVIDTIQSNNRRDNVRIEFRGVERTIAQWARILDIKRPTLWARLYKFKWHIEKAFNEPVREWINHE